MFSTDVIDKACSIKGNIEGIPESIRKIAVSVYIPQRIAEAIGIW